MKTPITRTSSMPLLVIVFGIGIIVGYTVLTEILPREKPLVIGESDLEFLPDEEYFERLLEVASRANKSVYVVMYVLKHDPREIDDPVNILLRKLVDLKKQGVDVRIVVDDETYESYPETIQYLKNNNISVRLDEGKTRTTHSKLVVIDDEYVFIGSHNWTESAFTRNHETTVLIKSSDLAKKTIAYFEKIWSNGRAI